MPLAEEARAGSCSNVGLPAGRDRYHEGEGRTFFWLQWRLLNKSKGWNRHYIKKKNNNKKKTTFAVGIKLAVLSFPTTCEMWKQQRLQQLCHISPQHRWVMRSAGKISHCPPVPSAGLPPLLITWGFHLHYTKTTICRTVAKNYKNISSFPVCSHIPSAFPPRQKHLMRYMRTPLPAALTTHPLNNSWEIHLAVPNYSCSFPSL